MGVGLNFSASICACHVRYKAEWYIVIDIIVIIYNVIMIVICISSMIIMYVMGVIRV